MNLQELNLVELNAQEVQETEGGILSYLVPAILYFAWDTITNPKASGDAFNAGFNAGNK